MARSFYISIVIAFLISGLDVQSKVYYEYNPESAAYNPVDGQYYFAYLGKKDKCNLTDPGFIAYMDENEELFKITIIAFWGNHIMGVNNPKGLLIRDNCLYMCEYNKFLIFDLDQDTAVKELYLNEMYYWKQSPSLNDICPDNNGNFYVTDYINNTIYKVDISTDSITDLGLQEFIKNPRCIEYDEENNRLILVSNIRNCPIQAVNLNDNSVFTLMETDISLMYGIAKDANGDYYVSAWEDSLQGAGKIYKFDKDFSSVPEVFSENHGGPSGIYYNPVLNELVVPNMLDTTINILSLDSPIAAPVLNYPPSNETNIETDLQLIWEETDRAFNYCIQIATDAEFTNLICNDTTRNFYYTYTGLSVNTEYYWRVKALNKVGEGPWAGAGKFTTSEELIAVPEMLSILETGNYKVPLRPTFKWTEMEADSFRIQISDNTHSIEKKKDVILGYDFFEPMDDFSGITGNEFTIPYELQNYKWYWWRIKAYAKNGTSAWSTPIEFYPVEVLFVENDFEGGGFSFYPNPASNNINIQNEALEIQEIDLIDCLGNSIAKINNINDEIINMPIDKYENGIYFLILKSKTKSYCKKLIISR